MHLSNIFAKDVQRPIEGVIKAPGRGRARFRGAPLAGLARGRRGPVNLSRRTRPAAGGEE